MSRWKSFIKSCGARRGLVGASGYTRFTAAPGAVSGAVMKSGRWPVATFRLWWRLFWLRWEASRWVRRFSYYVHLAAMSGDVAGARRLMTLQSKATKRFMRRDLRYQRFMGSLK